MTSSTAIKCDLLLKGGHVIDPANGIDGPMDVAVSGIKIAAVGPDIPSSSAARVADVSGCYVTPGLIDLHAHSWGSVAGDVPGRDVSAVWRDDDAGLGRFRVAQF